MISAAPLPGAYHVSFQKDIEEALSKFFGKGCSRGEIILNNPLVNARERLYVFDGDMLVEGVHRLADQAEFDHGAIIANEACIRRAAARRRSEERRVGKE